MKKYRYRIVIIFKMKNVGFYLTKKKLEERFPVSTKFINRRYTQIFGTLSL